MSQMSEGVEILNPGYLVSAQVQIGELCHMSQAFDSPDFIELQVQVAKFHEAISILDTWNEVVTEIKRLNSGWNPLEDIMIESVLT